MTNFVKLTRNLTAADVGKVFVNDKGREVVVEFVADCVHYPVIARLKGSIGGVGAFDTCGKAGFMIGSAWNSSELQGSFKLKAEISPEKAKMLKEIEELETKLQAHKQTVASMK